MGHLSSANGEAVVTSHVTMYKTRDSPVMQHTLQRLLKPRQRLADWSARSRQQLPRFLLDRAHCQAGLSLLLALNNPDGGKKGCRCAGYGRACSYFQFSIHLSVNQSLKMSYRQLNEQVKTWLYDATL